MKIKKDCVNCNKEFEVEFKQRDKKYCNRKCYFEYAKRNKTVGRKKDESKYEVRTCKVCSNDFEVRVKVTKEMCSDECRISWASLDANKNDRINKSKESLIKNYGVDSVFKIKSFRDDIILKREERCGVSNPMHILENVNKLKETLRDNQIDKLLPKLLKHNIELLGDYTKNKDNNTSISYRFKCLDCEHIFTSTVLGSGKIPICRKCNPIQKNSSLEITITDFLTENNISYEIGNRKILNGKEIDILIIDNNFGIEVNGNYWHSELFGEKDKNYHIDKTNLSKDKGIDLIHIFEDELLFKKEIVFSRLRNKLGITENKIYARKCDIREVSFKDKKIFLNKNHIQGNAIDKIRIGLYYDDELVSLMTFSKKRISLGQGNSNNEWELNRFSSKLNHVITGGFSKLLKYFIKNYNPHNIVTYADVRWSGLNENVYKSLFKFISITPPNYWYIKKGQYLHRSHRFTFRKDVLVSEGYDYKKTEWEIMQIKGYDRIWDCGNLKYEFNIMNNGASLDDI